MAACRGGRRCRRDRSQRRALTAAVTMEIRLEGTPLFLHAIDLVIADRDQRADADRAEALEILNTLRRELRSQARYTEALDGPQP